MKPSEKLTHVCGLRGGGCGVGLPGTGGASCAPQLWEHTELAMVPNALQRQSPDPTQAPSGLVTQQGTFVILFLSLQPHIGHCMVEKPRSCVPPLTIPRPGWNGCVACFLLFTTGVSKPSLHPEQPPV